MSLHLVDHLVANAMIKCTIMVLLHHEGVTVIMNQKLIGFDIIVSSGPFCPFYVHGHLCKGSVPSNSSVELSVPVCSVLGNIEALISCQYSSQSTKVLLVYYPLLRLVLIWSVLYWQFQCNYADFH